MDGVFLASLVVMHMHKLVQVSLIKDIDNCFLITLNVPVECMPLMISIINAPDSRSAENICATENAIAAVTKILQFNSSHLNANELLPTWLSWLPIWEDEEELPDVYGFLLLLIEK